MFTLSLEAFRSQNPLYSSPLPPSPIPSLDLVGVGLQPRDFLPFVVVAAIQTPPSLRSPAFPWLLATIPFRITSFAHPHHLTPIESHSCKKQGRGVGYPNPTHALPHFSTTSKHPTHNTARKSTLFMRLLHNSRHTPGGGLIVNRTPVEGCLSRASIGSTGSLRCADHGPFFYPTFKAFNLPTFQRRFSTIHRSLLAAHSLRENFYPPASDLRHNPAAQRHHLQSIAQTGRIQ